MKKYFAVLMCLLLFVPPAMAQRRDVQKDTVQGHLMYTLLKKGDIPGVYNPEYYGVDKAAEVYFSDEPLMIVSGESAIHAYSTWHLDRHEIVNDRIDGIPLAVTW